MLRQELHRPFRVFLLLIAIGLGSAVPARAASAPKPPESGARLQDFVPKGWAVLMQAEGDLNRDGKPDAALILKNPAEDSMQEEWPRPLVLLLQNPEGGGYRLSAASEQAVLCRTCGGIFGDPLAELQIKNGVVIIDHYGGSRFRWGYTHRWRRQDGDWILIGETKISHDTAGPEAKEDDFNWLTGDRIVKVTDADGKVKTTKRREAKKPPAKLSTFKFE
ncbi:MAG TPA: hypothetical protein VJR29_11285 [bacterium]|nr:hypothetical protein [bacterium]